jgi:hypothetical protein
VIFENEAGSNGFDVILLSPLEGTNFKQVEQVRAESKILCFTRTGKIALATSNQALKTYGS